MKLKVLGKNEELECNPKYKIGDIVKHIDYGNVYSIYQEALNEFNIPKIRPLNLKYFSNNKMSLFSAYIPEQLRKNTNWRIIDMALHYDKKSILYCIVTTNHLALVIDENGLIF